MIYLYHHNNQWMCFEGELPVKPSSYDYPTAGHKAHEENAAWEKYNQAIATLKSKALPVGNPEEFIQDFFYGCPSDFLDDNDLIVWPGTVTRALGCFGNTDQYILHLPKPKKIHNNIPPLPEYFYIEGPDEFVKGEPTAIDELFEEFETTMTRKFPPDVYGEDSELSVLYSIAEELRDMAKLVEPAFVAGRSKTSWEQFKKDNDL